MFSAVVQYVYGILTLALTLTLDNISPKMFITAEQ